MQKTDAILKQLTTLSPTILGLTLVRADGRPFFGFTPGQYATINFPDYRHLRGERSFSIASSATRHRELEFGIRVGGSYTKRLTTLQPGDRVHVRGPFGQFTMDPTYDRSVVLIAGGIGVTPFMSMIRTAAEANWSTEIRLIYAVRSLTDAAYHEELTTIAAKYPNLKVTYVVADQRVPEHSSYVAGRFTSDVLAAAVEQNPWGRTYYVCGPAGFMTAVNRMLKQSGVQPAAVRRERFSVATSAIIEPGTAVPAWAFAAWGIAAAMIFGVVVHVEQERREYVAAEAAAAAVVTPTTTETTTPVESTVITPTTTTPTTTTPAPTNSSTMPKNTSTTTTTPTTTVTPVQTTPTPIYYPMAPRTRLS